MRKLNFSGVFGEKKAGKKFLYTNAPFSPPASHSIYVWRDISLCATLQLQVTFKQDKRHVNAKDAAR